MKPEDPRNALCPQTFLHAPFNFCSQNGPVYGLMGESQYRLNGWKGLVAARTRESS